MFQVPISKYCPKLWRVQDFFFFFNFGFILECSWLTMCVSFTLLSEVDKSACHSVSETSRRQQTPESKTKDSLLLIVIAMIIISSSSPSAHTGLHRMILAHVEEGWVSGEELCTYGNQIFQNSRQTHLIFVWEGEATSISQRLFTIQASLIR